MKQKMYWKDGFYDEPVGGSVEITGEYYHELLSGQSAGKLIVENDEGYPILVEYEPIIEELRTQKIDELRTYDASDAVNQFSINGVAGWLNKSTRVGLMNSISVEEASGRAETGIWLGDALFMLSIDKAVDMLRQLELYALTCHNATQGHINAINQLETKEEIEAYDFRTGYPGKLNFTG
ncbi:DUF4376 domain-containing protein [uncultured Bacteroides sp.]|uniref:DUF4376 domain-containing protein n=1 Tax=uncultured Bacteroides sp. TaxID=162156 RepID=UPI00206DC6E4|nr:DUF4376 domain-containing protein [uncultured Bacteroides sp.]DAO06508.1 MAG TPA: protein of unknown function (DUF4376) [Caudoviricetes sp.]